MAIDMFLKVEGVTGESTDANHKDWIDVDTLGWGADQQATMAAGGGGGAGKVSYRQLRIGTKIDKATPALLKFSASGKHLGEVKLVMCKAGGTQIEYASIILKQVIVTNVQFTACSHSEQVYADYEFQAAEVEMHYWPQTAQGTRGAECQMGWDVKENKATA